MVANKYTSQLLYNHIAQNTSNRTLLRGGKCSYKLVHFNNFSIATQLLNSCHLVHNNVFSELPSESCIGLDNCTHTRPTAARGQLYPPMAPCPYPLPTHLP